jgi:hypothetical protein
MAGAERRKCKCCHKLFRPDARNVDRIVAAAEAALTARNYVSPIDVLSRNQLG